MTPIVRILRAFVWMRWRVLLNSLERSGSRDALERFSLAVEQLTPIIAVVLLIPSATILAGAGAYSGWAMAHGTPRPLPFEALRFLLFAACGLSVVGPLFLPAADRTSAIRLLLLPIPRPLLYLAQSITAIADPWILLVVPAVFAVPVGMAAGGAPGAAAFAAAGGLLLLATLVGLASVVTSLIHLLVRDRRRGEMLTLIFVLIIPLVAMLPGVLEDRSRRVHPAEVDTELRLMPAWLTLFEAHVLPLVPSEAYVRTARAPVEGNVPDALAALAGLTITVALLHAAALFVFGRLLDSPGAAGPRRRASNVRTRRWRVPGLSAGASAVAIAHIRLVLRTPRGRSTLLSPLMVFAVFAVMMSKGSTAGFSIVPLKSGIALAIVASFMSLLAILPMALNQFAVDGAGLTLEFLSPLDDKHLLRGKAVGNAVIAAIPVFICVGGAATLFPSGSLAVWLSIPIGIAAAYLLIAPVAAALSAVFPRTVDLNSIGRGSNAHGAATLLGLAAWFVAGAASLGVGVAAVRMLGYPSLAPILMLVWFALCAAVAKLLFVPVRALLARRRQNLALLRTTQNS
jgi:hypothetical protein